MQLWQIPFVSPMYSKAQKILEQLRKSDRMRKLFCTNRNRNIWLMGHRRPQTTVKTIGQKLKEATEESQSTFSLTQNISMAIQRGNASCVMGTVPQLEGLDEIFEFLTTQPQWRRRSSQMEDVFLYNYLWLLCVFLYCVYICVCVV